MTKLKAVGPFTLPLLRDSKPQLNEGAYGMMPCNDAILDGRNLKHGIQPAVKVTAASRGGMSEYVAFDGRIEYRGP